MKTLGIYLTILALLFCFSCSHKRAIIEPEAEFLSKEAQILKAFGENARLAPLLLVKSHDKFGFYSRIRMPHIQGPALDFIQKQLESKNIFEKIINANHIPINSEKTDDLFFVASRLGAKNILEIKEQYEVKSSLNILSALYVTLVGLYLFPGNAIQAECLVEGKLYHMPDGKAVMKKNSSAFSESYFYRPGAHEFMKYWVLGQAAKRASESLVVKFEREMRNAPKWIKVTKEQKK
jgi:hypothetical protein